MTDEDMIAAEEGFRTKPYRDHVGKWTIGYGRCFETNPFSTSELVELLACGITKEQADLLRANDLERIVTAARGLLSNFDTLTRARQQVIVNLSYNSHLVTWPRFLDAVQREDWVEAAEQILDSKAARDPKLTARYQRMAHAMGSDVNLWV